MALFGKSDDEANQREVDRLAALPLETLAAEVFTHIDGIELDFGAPGPDVFEVAEAMAPTKLKGKPRIAMVPVVAEGMQVLEHARLVLSYGSDGESSVLQFALTRAGRAALERGDVVQRLRGTSI